MIVFRKSVLMKFFLLALSLVVAVYLFTLYEEQIHSSYESINSSLKWDTNKAGEKGSDFLENPVRINDTPGAKGEQPTPDEAQGLQPQTENTNKHGLDNKELIDGQTDADKKAKGNNHEGGSKKTPDDKEFETEKPDETELELNEYYNDIEDLDDEFDSKPEIDSSWDDSKKETMTFIHQESLKDTTLKKRKSFFNSVFKLISDAKPSIGPLDEYPQGKCGVQFVDNKETPFYTFEELSKYLKISDDEVEELKEKHESIVSKLPIGEPPKIYQKGSSGIVYVGGNRFTWLTLISIMNLRETGCELPVEILIPKFEEYELNICQNIFPKYNAKCIYLPTLVGDTVFNKYNFKGYQYKSLALALSSFENVLLLDADNTPLRDPTDIFSSSAFVENGMVLWPDFWKRTTSPKYYEIIGRTIDQTKRRSFGYSEYSKKVKSVTSEGTVLFHQLENTLPDPTTESGQVLLSKSKHFKSLILCLYYNTYGPDYYYPLLSQGAAGEGDKETFIAAAHALNEDYYTVKKHVVALGRFRDGNFHGSAMGQFDVVKDFELYEQYHTQDTDVVEEPSLLFLHANFPKLDPWSLNKDDIIIDARTGERNRLFGVGFIDTVKFDFELRTWRNMETLLCDQKLEFSNFKDDGVTTAVVCKEVKEHIEYLVASLGQ